MYLPSPASYSEFSLVAAQFAGKPLHPVYGHGVPLSSRRRASLLKNSLFTGLKVDTEARVANMVILEVYDMRRLQKKYSLLQMYSNVCK